MKWCIASRVITIGQVIDDHVAFAAILAAIIPCHDDARASEKGSLPVKFPPRLPRQVQVDGFQMARTVVTGDARYIQTQENTGHVDAELVHPVEPISADVVVLAVRHPVGAVAVPSQEGKSRNRTVAFRDPSQQVIGHRVVGSVQAQPLLVPEMECMFSLARPALQAEQIPPVPGPLFGKFFGADQVINDGVPLQRIFTGQKLTHHVRRRKLAYRIEINTSDEFFIAAQPRMWNPIALHSPKDVFIDKILAHDLMRTLFGSRKRPNSLFR